MNQGLKGYTKQFTHNVSGVGRLAFNMCGAAKNMHMIIPLISTVGHSPINLSLIYNEQDKDVSGQFGKGFRLNTFQKLSSIDEGYEILNADGSTDKYLESNNYYNKETGFTLISDDECSVYELTDYKGNGVVWDNLDYLYPECYNNSYEQSAYFNRSSSTVFSISNSHEDNISFLTNSNEITVTYAHNGTVVSKTVLLLSNDRIVGVRYYEGTSTLVGKFDIKYEINYMLLTNLISCNLTKIVYENSGYKIYDGFKNGTSEVFASTPDFTITYNTLNSNTYNKTTLQNKLGDFEMYHFNSSHLVNMIEDQHGKVKFCSYDKETKNLKTVNDVFINDEDNLARDLSFVMPSAGSGAGGNIGIVGPTEPVLGSQTTVSEIWNKLTYYSVAGSNNQTISVSGEAGDVVTFSFFADVYAQSASVGAASIGLTVGSASKDLMLLNKVNTDIEMYSISVIAKEKFNSVNVSLIVPSGGKLRLGAYTMLINKHVTNYTYNGKSVSSIDNGNSQTNVEYDSNNNPIKVTIKEKTWLERVFNDKNLVTQSTNKYGTVTNIEYDDDYPTNVVKEQIVCESEAIMVEEQKEYTDDGRFLKADYDEFGEKTQFEYDSLGRVIKVTDALNNVLNTTYENGLLKTLKLNTSAQNTYTYDERNRLTKIELPGSSNYEFVYDYKNQITQIKMNGLIILTYIYDSLGNVTRQRYGTSGDYYDFVYDSKNRIVNIKLNGTLKYVFEYQNELLIEVLDGSGTLLKEFTYDDQNRLIRTDDYRNSLDTKVENQISNDGKVTGKNVTVGIKTIHQSFDDFERSDDASITSSGDVKTIGFAGTNLTCDTQAVMEVFDIYPLHHDADPIDSTKTKPFLFTYKNVGGENQPKTPFVHNSATNRFTYCANYGTLAYKFGNSTSGTIMARVLKITSNNEYLFGFVDTNGDKFDVLLEGTGHIVLYVNGNVVTSTRMSFSPWTWHTVGISYGKGANASSTDTTHTRYFRLFLDGTVKTYSVTASTSFTTMKSCIGYSESSSSSFTGCMEMLCFRNAYCEETTLDEMMSAMNIISTKSYVDEFQRINKKEVTKGSTNIISNEFEYDTTTYWLQKYATYRVKKEVIKAGNNTIATRTYTYDKLGRVTKITDSKFGTKTYAYNDRGFLINDNGTTITYEGNGNIKKYGSDTFEYDATVKDKLVKYKGVSISYSSSNPLSIESTPYHYIEYEGKRMTYCESGAGYGFYEYNEQGLRTKKDWYGSPNITSSYYYDGDRLVTEVRNSDRLDFLYDEAGLLYGFILNNASKYFYVRDILQNILGIIDESGTLVVQYDYNAFGKILSVTDTSGLSIGELNPFRYKGYYYDSEIEMYYCVSRYYNPILCRWLVPDSIRYLDCSSINGMNLYCYCMNNPIMYVDKKGHISKEAAWVISGILIVAGIAMCATGFLGILGGIFLSAGVNSLLNGYINEANGGEFWAGYCGGIITGALCGLGAGLGGAAFIAASNTANLACLGYLSLGVVASFAGGFLGNIAGTVYTSWHDSGFESVNINWDETLQMSTLMGTLNIFAGLASGTASIVAKATECGTKTTLRVLAGSIAGSAEFIYDAISLFFSELISNI